MTLSLYYHPLASFCHKVLIALYENETNFDAKLVDFADESSTAQMLSYWPVGKIPVLRDEARQKTVPETSVIIEYVQQHYAGAATLLPADPDHALDVRLWDRFFDLYVSVPMQKVVLDRLRGADHKDPFGVQEAKDALRAAYDMLERQLQRGPWACGESFSMADCSAAPALFYATILVPLTANHPNTSTYFERLLARPSFARVLNEARPYFTNFPFYADMPARFR